jgi:hypothetical protein
VRLGFGISPRKLRKFVLGLSDRPICSNDACSTCVQSSFSPKTVSRKRGCQRNSSLRSGEKVAWTGVLGEEEKIRKKEEK